MATYSKTIRSKAGASYALGLSGRTVLANLPPFYPMYFDRWPGGSLYVSNGLGPIYKWNGLRSAFTPVGLTAPSGTPVVAGSGSGSLSGTYRIFVRFVDEDGQYSPLSTASAEATVTSAASFAYSSLPTPTDPRVVKRQVLRNTDGQYTTFYVDVETTDLWSTSLSTTTTDDSLAGNEAVPLFDDDGNSLTDQWEAPRTDKPILAHFHDRMYAAGETAYTFGNARVTFGSTTVTGTATSWTSSMVGREFSVVGHATKYEIASVNVSAQTMTLTAFYRGSTDQFATYSIRSSQAERNTLYYSMANEPERWPPTQGLTVADAADGITALIPTVSYMYIGFADSLFNFTSSQNPAIDGAAYRAATRGVVNQHCWCEVLDSFYVLDKIGVYRIDQGQVTDVSEPIRDLFSLIADGVYKIDWTRKEMFFAVHDAASMTVCFGVSLNGPSLPHHLLCYDYVKEQWWIDEFAFPITAATVWHRVRRRVLMAGLGMKLFERGVGYVDGPNPTGYTLAGNVASATLGTLTDTYLSVPSSGIVGAPIAITGGTGKGQVRLIDAASGTTIQLTQPWSVLPDSTSTYQIGGFLWQYRSPWFELDDYPSHECQVVFKPQQYGSFDVRFFVDHSTTPVKYGSAYPLAAGDSDGVFYSPDTTDAVVKLNWGPGFVHFVTSQPGSPASPYGRFIAVEMGGFSNPGGVFLHEVRVTGASKV